MTNCARCQRPITSAHDWLRDEPVHFGCLNPPHSRQLESHERHRERPPVDSRIIRMGDALLWGWGEARRNGILDALLQASIAAIRGESSGAGSPGTHSDPTLARMLEAESQEAQAAMLVDLEIQRWKRMPEVALWPKVAEGYYAAPYRRTNAEVGSLLRVSTRSVVQARDEMRRVLVVTVQAARETA